MFDDIQQQILNSPEHKIVVVSSAGSGKALENGSKIYTENGPINIEDAQVGMNIFGDDGKLHSITGVFPQGKKKKYIVTLTDGTKINCCDEHLWTFQTENQRSHKSKTWTTLTLREIIDRNLLYSRQCQGLKDNKDKLYKRRNIWLPMTQPVEFPKQNLPLPPYLLGALLGDGSLGGAGRTTRFTNQDTDVLAKVEMQLNEIGCSLKQLSSGIDFSIMQQGKGKKGRLTSILENLGLNYSRSGNKFIPTIYKYSCITDRIELLKGIIDTDGYCNGGHYDLVLKSKQLILDIQELCESLGLTATYQEKKAICTNSSIGKKDCGTVYRLYIKVSSNINKIHSSQRREQQWKPTKFYASRAFASIEETNEYVNMTCISVDNPSKLFLTDHFVVTHNTSLLTARVKYLLDNGIDLNSIAVITFTNLAAEEMQSRLKDIQTLPFIGTIHSFANQGLLRHGIETGKLLDEEKYDELLELGILHFQCFSQYQYILWDEVQDSGPLEFEFIIDCLNPFSFFLVMDPRQSIYGFKGAQPKLGMGLTRKSDVTTYFMNTNYRCGSNILNFAKKLIAPNGLFDESESGTGTAGSVMKMDFSYKGIVSYLVQNPDYKNWAILTRTNAEITAFSTVLTNNKIPFVTFKQGDLNKAELGDRLNSNAIKLLTVHSAKGLAFDNVIVVGMRSYNDEERCIEYVAATRARKRLIWTYAVPKRRKTVQTFQW